MAATTSKSQSPAAQNPSSSSKRAYYVGGISVEFPYQPYGTQLAFMGKVISTLERAQREGHSHALLESPTGTGKSLSLLCSTLAWQQTQKLKNIYANLNHSKPDPQAMTDPLGHGGGFVPETQPSRFNFELCRNSASLDGRAGHSSTGEKEEISTYHLLCIVRVCNLHCPYFRLSDLSSVNGENPLKMSSSFDSMLLLIEGGHMHKFLNWYASRKHYCTNKFVIKTGNIDEEWSIFLSLTDFFLYCGGKVVSLCFSYRVLCYFFSKLLMKEMKDNEGGCSYFKNVNKIKAHPSLQKGGCHEVHDIEDLVKVGTAVKGCPYYAARAMADDAQLVFCPYSYVINPIIRGAMEVDITGAIIVLDEAHNIEDIARDAGSVDLEEDALQSSWSGDQALRELQEANITKQCFPILLECALQAIKDATDKETEFPLLSGMAVTILEGDIHGLFSSLTYFFARNGSHVSDYQLVVQRKVKKDSKNDVGGWTHIFSLWCLNPAVVFKDIAQLSLSVILTSGTLSPTNSFSSELGVNFGNCLEAPHVVDIKSQVWTAVISSGPGNYPLNASYKTASVFAFQDALGKSLEEIFKVVPAGSLAFFPSYNLMEKLSKRWRETGQWARLNAQKSLFVEPRGGTQEDFDSLLKRYYNSVSRHSKVPVGTKKRNKKPDLKNATTTEPLMTSKKDGGAFLAVCRGKASEGIDFSDDNARVVSQIIVGIPFPNINDTQVCLKKKYNDSFKSSKNLLSGNEWYCHQAFRALNQAAGRCIRHKSDYGAIIFLDERFKEERNTAYVSKWLRKSIQHYGSFDESLEGLKSFFRDAKNIGGQTTPTPVLNMFKKEKGVTKDMENSCSGESTHKRSGPCCREQPIVIEDDIESCPVIDLECNSPMRTRFDDTSTSQDPASTMVKETPDIDGNSPENLSTGMDYHSSMIQPSYEMTTPTTSLLQVQGSSVCSPEKVFSISTYSPSPEVETSHIRSVNSRTQKRRKMVDSSPLVLPSDDNSGGCNESRPFSGLDSNGMMQRLSFGPSVSKSLRISCSLCEKPLGRPENDLSVECLSTSSSKVHLLSLVKDGLGNEAENSSTKVPVVVVERLSVDHMLCNSSRDDVRAEGVWCEEDGCVFKSIYCPSCTKPHCLGAQVIATDASNVQLLNKNHVPVNGYVGKTAVPEPFKRFSYSPSTASNGWRSTKFALRKDRSR
ncbi:Fanconi anemia group J protein homolog [Linum grandiflorum]